MVLSKFHRQSLIVVSVYSLTGMLALSACHSSSTDKLVNPLVNDPTKNLTTPETPKVDFNEMNALMESIMVCDKKDSELPLGQFDLKTAVVVRDKIDNMDIQEIDCDKKVKSTHHGPVRNLSQAMIIEAPAELKGPVNYVVVENLRTCSTQKLNAIEDLKMNLSEDPAKNNSEGSVASSIAASEVGQSGVVKLMLSDMDLKISSLFLNVKDNSNVIILHYYGKCLEYKKEKANSDSAIGSENSESSAGDAERCLVAEELGLKQILLSVQVERPEVSGTSQQNVCSAR